MRRSHSRARDVGGALAHRPAENARGIAAKAVGPDVGPHMDAGSLQQLDRGLGLRDQGDLAFVTRYRFELFDQRSSDGGQRLDLLSGGGVVVWMRRRARSPLSEMAVRL